MFDEVVPDVHCQDRGNDMKRRCEFICLKCEISCRLANAYFRVWQLRYLYNQRLNTYGAAGPLAMPAGGFNAAKQAIIDANIDACVNAADSIAPPPGHTVLPG